MWMVASRKPWYIQSQSLMRGPVLLEGHHQMILAVTVIACH